MSTTFGVQIPSTGEVIEVARRVGRGPLGMELTWTNELGELLPNNTEVIAMDNGQQGINTAGDIHFQIMKQNEFEENKMNGDKQKCLFCELVNGEDSCTPFIQNGKLKSK
tara:strand:- start:539 stop:868 length:330 start_codon:yes stop_codon:yes gene_type:complete